jgi:cation transport ATPase
VKIAGCAFITIESHVLQTAAEEEENMKKVCRLDGLGCASCAAKIENAVAKISGVSAASVNFITTKMVIEGDDARMDEILTQATAIVKKVEPDVVVRKA